MSLTVVGALVRLRLLRVLRDRSGLVWLLVMPMVFSYLMGKLMGGVVTGNQPGEAPRFMVYDGDHGSAVTKLLAPLQDNEKFRVVRVDSVIPGEVARRAVEEQRITAALIVPAGFSADLAARRQVELVLYFDSDRLSSQTVNTLLDQAVLRSNTATAARGLVAAGGGAVRDGTENTPRDRARDFDEEVFGELWTHPHLTLAAATLGRIQTEETRLSDPHQHLGPAYVLFFVMMFLMMTAKDLVAARQDRTLARLIVSRATGVDLMLGFFLGGMVVGLVQSGILLALNGLAFHIDYGDSLAGLVLVVVLFAGFSSGAAIFLGSVARTGAQADGLGMAVTMTMAALGGLWWPLEVVPEFMQHLGHALPTGQAITVFHDMIGRGYGLPQLAPLLGALAVWCAVAMALGAWRLRRLIP